MTKSEYEIKVEIKSFIDRNNGDYSSWYVGISEDARNRLFKDHNVNERDVRGWIYEIASSSDVARRVEDYFVNILKTSGNPGGGSEDSNEVYAYKKKSHTNP